MKRKWLSVASFVALLVCAGALGVTTHAQTRDKYLISVKAGGVNFVSGNVTVNRRGANARQSVTDRDNLEIGDAVTTDAGGRVEVLLNPGSYLRVDENSEFEFSDNSLEHLRIKLGRGSAIIEAVGTDDTELAMEILTPQTTITIVKKGIYRINVLPTSATEVLVRNGRALVGQPAEVVKGGQKIIVSAGRMEMSKLDKKEQNAFDFWSRERAEYLASINRGLQQNALYSTFNDYYNDYWSQWDFYGRYHGMWVLDRNRRCYVFAPWRRGNWGSPYGYGYRRRGNLPPCNNCGNDPRRRGASSGGRNNPPPPPPAPSGSGGTVPGGVAGNEIPPEGERNGRRRAIDRDDSTLLGEDGATETRRGRRSDDNSGSRRSSEDGSRRSSDSGSRGRRDSNGSGGRRDSDNSGGRGSDSGSSASSTSSQTPSQSSSTPQSSAPSYSPPPPASPPPSPPARTESPRTETPRGNSKSPDR